VLLLDIGLVVATTISWTDKTYQQHQGTDIEILKEILGSLRITKEYVLDKNRTTEPATLNVNMLTASVPAVLEQAVTHSRPKIV